MEPSSYTDWPATFPERPALPANQFSSTLPKIDSTHAAPACGCTLLSSIQFQPVSDCLAPMPEVGCAPFTPAVTTHVFPSTTQPHLSLDEPIADLRGVAIRLRDQPTPPQRAVRLHLLASRLNPRVASEPGADLMPAAHICRAFDPPPLCIAEPWPGLRLRIARAKAPRHTSPS